MTDTPVYNGSDVLLSITLLLHSKVISSITPRVLVSVRGTQSTLGDGAKYGAGGDTVDGGRFPTYAQEEEGGCE